MPERSDSQAHSNAVDNARAMATIAAKLDIFVEEFKSDRTSSALHRKDLREVIGALSEGMRVLTAQVAEIAPVMRDYQNTRAEARGAAKLMKFAWTLAVALAGALGAWIGKKFS